MDAPGPPAALPVPAMVEIAAGTFLMGSPADEAGRVANEGPRHPVTIGAAFALARHPVTIAEFAAFAADAGYAIADRCRLWDGDDWRELPGSFRTPGFAAGPRHPAVCVGWHDAQAYAAWLAARTGARFRLPSEAEWEYAARAGTTTRFAWGEEFVPGLVNCSGAAAGERPGVGHHPLAVASLPANAWGLHEMHGNVWEWVADAYAADHAGAPADGRARQAAPGGLRVLRGGSWRNGPNGMRAARRHGAPPDYCRADIGFRLARTLASGELAEGARCHA